MASLKAALEKATRGTKVNASDARAAPATRAAQAPPSGPTASPQKSGSSSSTSANNNASEQTSNPGDTTPATPDAGGNIEATMPTATGGVVSRDGRSGLVGEGVAAGKGVVGGDSGRPKWAAPTSEILLAARERLSKTAASFAGTGVKEDVEVRAGRCKNCEQAFTFGAMLRHRPRLVVNNPVSRGTRAMAGNYGMHGEQNPLPPHACAQRSASLAAR